MLNKLTKKYLIREVDKRMVNIIENNFHNENIILDLACGAGIYGKYLKLKCKKLFGYDYDPALCSHAKSHGFYDNVICDDIINLDGHISLVNCVFCSEFLEHINNDKLEGVVNKIENITSEKIIFTVPNPLSPHFKMDSSHILKYSIYSLLKNLNESKKFSYTLYSLGFSQQNLQKWYFKMINPLSSKISILSPTVLYVGALKTYEN